MNKLSIKKFGLAFGITGALLYLGCSLLMAILGRGGTVKIFNSLLHGLDTASIIRMNIPWWEELLGLAGTFVICWLTGSCIAAIYNALK
jgi:hypothetical protein